MSATIMERIREAAVNFEFLELLAVNRTTSMADGLRFWEMDFVKSPVPMSNRRLVFVALGSTIGTHSPYQAGFANAQSSHFHPMRFYEDLMQEGYSFIVNFHHETTSIRDNNSFTRVLKNAATLGSILCSNYSVRMARLPHTWMAWM